LACVDCAGTVSGKGKPSGSEKWNQIKLACVGSLPAIIRGRKIMAANDAIALLKADHKEVADLLERFEKARAATKQKIAQQICDSLTVHAQIEEEIFYPAAREALGDDGEDLLNEAKVEHESLKELIAKIEGSSSDEELFDANVKVLGEYVKHHVKEEQNELFPKCRKSDMDLVALGTELAARKKELKSEMKAAA
jgi:iron-sulfur cluster repair protein YtfE (RIC family)